MELDVIITQMALLFIIMAIGFVVGKTKMLTPDGNKLLTRIVLFIALPCTILNSVFENEINLTIGDTLYFLLMALLTFAIAFAVSIPVIYILGGEKKNRGLLNFMSVFSNCGFMGFPVVIAIMGLSSAYYVALFNIPFNVLVFSIGIFMISSGKKDATGDGVVSQNATLHRPLSQLINPVLIVALIAIPIALIGFKPPQIIADAIKITGNITTPGGMLVIGSTLAHMHFKSILSEWRIIPVTLLKLIVIPVVTWFILKNIISNEMLLGVLVLVSAMPSAAMASMLAIEYGGNEKTASAGVFLTTLLCGLTVPLLVYLLF